MEIRTGVLNDTQLEHEVDYLTSFFSSREIDSALIAYGWGCRLTVDELWRYEPVPVHAIGAFIQDSRKQDRFYLGESDLLITDPAGRLRFVLCHESDVHFDGDPEAVAQVAEHWRNQGFVVQMLQ